MYSRETLTICVGCLDVLVILTLTTAPNDRAHGPGLPMSVTDRTWFFNYKYYKNHNMINCLNFVQLRIYLQPNLKSEGVEPTRWPTGRIGRSMLL
jgi:hypothetical protein